VTWEHHPLFGDRLAVEGWKTIEGTIHLVVRLPDGSPGTIQVAHTSAGGSVEDQHSPAMLSVEGIRRLRLLVLAKLHDPGGSHT
jgi:hypothetical protein